MGLMVQEIEDFCQHDDAFKRDNLPVNVLICCLPEKNLRQTK